MLLAPIIKERKGNTPKRWRTWQARVTSVLVLRRSLRSFRSAETGTAKETYHEVVVDRFKVRDDLTQRLAESLKPRWSFPVVPR